MDYKVTELGRQANSQGAVMVDGAFYCPAMPEALVSASCDKRRRQLSTRRRIEARVSARPRGAWCAKKAPTRRLRALRLPRPRRAPPPEPARCGPRPPLGRWARSPCPRRPRHRPRSAPSASVTIAPDIGARFRQDLAFGSEEWARTYASYRNTIEGWNGYLKDTAHEALASPGAGGSEASPPRASSWGSSSWPPTSGRSPLFANSSPTALLKKRPSGPAAAG